jgi:hypothetical protein
MDKIDLKPFLKQKVQEWKRAKQKNPDMKSLEQVGIELLVYCYNSAFTMSNLFQDGVNVFRPNEWFRVCVV